MNSWLDSTVKNYERYFGKTDKPVVWEVGAFDAADGVELAKRIYNGNKDWFWTYATIVAIEPNPEQVKIIRKKYPEVEVLELAASNEVGRAPFVVYHGSPGDVGSSSLNVHWKDQDFDANHRHEIAVKINRLDRLIKDEQIDIMKIDVEGYSIQVLEGLGDKLKQVKTFHVETENFTDSNIKIKAFMMSHGFTLVDEVEQYGGFPDQVWVRS